MSSFNITSHMITFLQSHYLQSTGEMCTQSNKSRAEHGYSGCNSALNKLRQQHCQEFKATLSYNSEFQASLGYSLGTNTKERKWSFKVIVRIQVESQKWWQKRWQLCCAFRIDTKLKIRDKKMGSEVASRKSVQRIWASALSCRLGSIKMIPERGRINLSQGWAS